MREVKKYSSKKVLTRCKVFSFPLLGRGQGEVMKHDKAI
jgi:hypothetical protein